MKIPKGIHRDYTIIEKGKNVDRYDTLREDEEFEEALLEKQIQAQITKEVVNMVNQDQPGIQIMHIVNKVTITLISKQPAVPVKSAK
uniref:Uncharacterized protein n=1 Tax=Romanomermis culicivorax TaxID=13658 RepID=A0A915I8U7_ROMCU